MIYDLDARFMFDQKRNMYKNFCRFLFLKIFCFSEHVLQIHPSRNCD